MNATLAALVLLLGADKAAAPAPAATSKPAVAKPAATPKLEFQSDMLCTTGETLVFSCSIPKKGKHASICASSDYSETSGYLVYRFGKPSKIELTYPEKLDDTSRAAFGYGMMSVSGGGGEWYRFKNGDVEYYLYEGTGKGWSSSGISVQKDGAEIAKLECVPTAGPTDIPKTDEENQFDFPTE